VVATAAAGLSAEPGTDLPEDLVARLLKHPNAIVRRLIQKIVSP